MLERLARLWKPDDKLWTPVRQVIQAGKDTISRVLRRNRRGRPYMQSELRMGPNEVHAWIGRGDGTIEDLGISRNLLTNIGRDVLDGAWGFMVAGNTLASNISTAVGATSITGTGSVWTASNLATPQLGCAGMRVYASPHTTTNPLVWGNIISNTTNVLTIDQWWKLPTTGGNPPVAGTTPTSSDSFTIAPGGISAVQMIALSTNASAASASDTTLTSEVTSNGCGRVLATYAHSFGATTLTLSNTFTASGTVTAIHKAGAFGALSSAGADPMIFETVLSADATLVSADTLAVTWTFTLSG